MAEALVPPAGPVSTAIAAPLGAKDTANNPGPALGLTTIGDSVPLLCTSKASMLLVSFSVTSSVDPVGLKASEAAPEFPVLKYVVEWAIGANVPPLPSLNPETLLAAPALRT